MSGLRASRARAAIALAWLAAAAALLPLAPGVEDRLEVSARILGSESAEVDRLLVERFESPFSRSALLVLAGVEAPDRPGGAGRARPGRPRARGAPGGDGHLLLPRPGGRVLRGRGRRHVRGGRPRRGRGPRGPPPARVAPGHGGPAGRASSRAPTGDPALDRTGGPQLRPLALERRRDPPRRAAHASSHPRAPPVRVRVGRGGRPDRGERGSRGGARPRGGRLRRGALARSRSWRSTSRR